MWVENYLPSRRKTRAEWMTSAMRSASPSGPTSVALAESRPAVEGHSTVAIFPPLRLLIPSHLPLK